MNKLKFSHDYEKLPDNWDGTQAILIGVAYHDDIQEFFKQCPQLLNTDTKLRGEPGHYTICAIING